jgi:hypothetical protein
VVPGEDGVDARLLRRRHGAAELGVVGVLGLELDGDADPAGHG